MLDLTFPHREATGTPCCRLRVFYALRAVGQTTVIFRTAVATHPPPDIIPLANLLVTTHQIDPDRLIWINYVPATRRFWIFPVPERFVRLRLEWNGTTFTHAMPEPLTPSVAHTLIGKNAL